MKNKKTGIAFALIAVFAITLSFMVTAYKGNYDEKGPECTEDRHELIMNAFNELDYDAWKAIMTEKGNTPGALRLVTEENFHLFVKAHEAGKAGNYALANKLRTELGFNNGEGPKNGDGFGKKERLGEMKHKGQSKGIGGTQQHKNQK